MTATMTATTVTLARAPFAAALKDAARVLAAKPPLSILNCVLLTSNGAVLRVGATDLSVSLVRSLELGESSDLRFSLAVPGAELATLVGNLGSAEVTLALDLERRTLQVRAEGVQATFKTQPGDDYPLLPEPADATWELPTLTLQQALSQTMFAAAEDDGAASRPVLAGIALQVEGDSLLTRAADGFRGSMSRHGLLVPMGERLSQITPLGAIKQLTPLLGKADALVGVWRDRGSLIFAIGDTLLATRLIEGEFPDMNRIIPVECSTTVVCSAVGLLAAVRQVEVLAEKQRDDKNKGPAVTSCRLEIETDALSVSTAGSLGDGTSTLAAAVNGLPLTIGVNTKYLREALEAVGATQVELGMNTNTSPLRIRRVGDREFTQVLMPMHLAPKAVAA